MKGVDVDRRSRRAGLQHAVELLAATCVVLPLDTRAADRAAAIWTALGTKQRRALADILIAAIASVHGAALVTRNRRDFAAIAAVVDLSLVDWSR